MEEKNVSEAMMDEVRAMEDAQEREDNTFAAPSGPQDDLLKARVVETLCTIYDPEIPVDIYELGLIYKLDVAPGGQVNIEMTLTSPACPVAESLPIEVEAKVAGVAGVSDVSLELVWEPPYSMDRMSETARLQLGLW